MTLEIIHTDRSYVVVDNERGRWSAQYLYNSYLNARKFALAWKAAAKLRRLVPQVVHEYLERAEALAALLGRLANSTLPSEHGNAPDVRQCIKDRKAARALAAKIKGALETNDD